MSRVLQIRRGTATQNDNFTGMAGELSFDTDNKTIRVHDGTTLGGFALARADGTSGGDGGTTTSGGTAFDINSVPDEFWAQKVAQFTPATTGTVFTKYDSSLVPVTTNASLEYLFTTNGTDAAFVNVFLVCQAADAGYAIGDVVRVFGIGSHICTGANTYVEGNTLHVRLMIGGASFWVYHRTTGVVTNITNANWRIRFRVYC